MNINRRTLLALSGASMSGMSGLALAQGDQATAPYSDRQVTDEWIRTWLSSPGAAVGNLHLGRFADAMYWLRRPIGWSPNPGQEAHKPVTAPKGFVTDFASIPRVFWTALPKDGVYTYPAIIHDYLYWEQPVSRAEADTILKLSMEDFKINAATIQAVYRGVQFGGSWAWNDNAKRKQAGEKRYMLLEPTDPTTRWDAWKTKTGAMRGQA